MTENITFPQSRWRMVINQLYTENTDYAFVAKTHCQKWVENEGYLPHLSPYFDWM